MKKTLYSLMLDERVVREVDLKAHRLGTNRSALINQILADYVSVVTPERRIDEIFRTVEALLDPVRELVPQISNSAFTMCLKSSLSYKYRPTFRYEVELFRSEGEAMGQLSVVFRTQSAPLVDALGEFFALWQAIEEKHLAPQLRGRISYSPQGGRFVRSLMWPASAADAAAIAAAISDYIKLFDTLIKAWLADELGDADIESEYYSHMVGRKILI